MRLVYLYVLPYSSMDVCVRERDTRARTRSVPAPARLRRAGALEAWQALARVAGGFGRWLETVLNPELVWIWVAVD